MKHSSIIAVCGPSGSGKTTLVKKLIEEFDFFEFSISATTREKRGGEEDGKDYHFISEEDFKQRISANELIEYEEVYPGLFYGTLKSEIQRIWGNKKYPLLDIDVMGAQNLKKIYKNAALTIFIHPGTIDNLKSRLLLRKTDAEKSLRKRLDKAAFEIKQSDKFDFIIKNDKEIQIAYSELREIILKYLD
jgi:guanylate kinase